MAASKLSATRPWPGVVSPAARRPLLISGSLGLALMAVAILALAVFGGSGASRSAAAHASGPSILTGSIQPTTFGQARVEVLALYRSHPAVTGASFDDVDYTAATRDKEREETEPACFPERIHRGWPMQHACHDFDSRNGAPIGIRRLREPVTLPVSCGAVTTPFVHRSTNPRRFDRSINPRAFRPLDQSAAFRPLDQGSGASP